MSFASKLKDLMNQLDLSQKQLSEMTGIGVSSISQYLNGRNEPYKERKKEIARALGVQEDYFNDFLADAQIQTNEVTNLPVKLVARLMHKSEQWVRQGLMDNRFPWGYAVKMSDWSFYISSVKFTEYTGIPVPYKETQSGDNTPAKEGEY